MGVKLTEVQDTATDAAPLVIVPDGGPLKINDALSLAVAQRAGGPMVLARVSVKTDKTTGEKVESVRATSRLSDIAHALSSGLID